MVAVAAERSAAATAGRAAVGPAEGEEEEARSEPTLANNYGFRDCRGYRARSR